MNEKNVQLLSELIRMKTVSKQVDNVNRILDRVALYLA